jgi:hypothetical protein
MSMSQGTVRKPAILTPNASSRRSLRQRIATMMIVWACFGIPVGICSAPGRDSALNLLSGIIAGVIVLPWVGALLALLGGEVLPVVLGGMAGAVLGALTAGLAAPAALFHTAGVGLVGGGIVAATFFSFLRQARQTLARVFAHQTGPAQRAEHKRKGESAP